MWTLRLAITSLSVSVYLTMMMFECLSTGDLNGPENSAELLEKYIRIKVRIKDLLICFLGMI